MQVEPVPSNCCTQRYHTDVSPAVPMYAAATHLAELEPPSQGWHTLITCPWTHELWTLASPKTGDNLSAAGVWQTCCTLWGGGRSHVSHPKPSVKMLGDTRMARCSDQPGWNVRMSGFLSKCLLRVSQSPYRRAVSTLPIFIHLMLYFKTSVMGCQKMYLASMYLGVSNGWEFQGIKYIHRRKMDCSMSRCKMIGFISSQTLPQVTLGMLEIMKYKIPLLRITYFPHHYLYCRFTITLTSKLRKLFLYSKQRVL